MGAHMHGSAGVAVHAAPPHACHAHEDAHAMHMRMQGGTARAAPPLANEAIVREPQPELQQLGRVHAGDFQPAGPRRPATKPDALELPQPEGRRLRRRVAHQHPLAYILKEVISTRHSFAIH